LKAERTFQDDILFRQQWSQFFQPSFNELPDASEMTSDAIKDGLDWIGLASHNSAELSIDE
jgi:hypothetical protein